MKTKIPILLLLLLSFQVSGCAVIMAMKQPEKKNLSVLTHGAPRDNVLMYLGAPISSEMKGNERHDLFQFQQGYTKGTKVTRAVVHGILDLGTIFIWEIIGTPTEAVVDGHKMTIKVVYDEKDNLKDFTIMENR